MAILYKSFEDIKEPRLRHYIEVLAKLYHNGDVNEALADFNKIRLEMDRVTIASGQSVPSDSSEV